MKEQSFRIPEGAIPLAIIDLSDRRNPKVTPCPGVDEAATEFKAQVAAYVEEHDRVPEFFEPWQQVARSVARWRQNED